MKKLLLILLVVICGCSSNKNMGKDVINIADFEVKNWDEIPSGILKLEKIKLVNNSGNSQMNLSSISDIKMWGDKIYILDERMKKLVIFDLSGNAVMSLNRQGRGPGEFLQISYFDIDKQGNIYVVDGNSDKLLVYNNNGDFIRAVKPPCEIDLIKVLENDKYLLQLSSWNRGSFSGSQVILADSGFVKGDEILRYSEYRDDNFWLSESRFIETKKGIFYHKQIDDHVYLFNRSGEIEKTYFFDFGSAAIPDTYKTDVEKWFNNKELFNYSTLVDFTVIGDQFIYGSMFDKGERIHFIADRDAKVIYKNEISLMNKYGVLCGSSSDKIIFYELQESLDSQGADFVLLIGNLF